jgi:hypothetical protein
MNFDAKVCSEATISAVVSPVVPVVSPVFSPVRAAVDAMRNHRHGTDGGSGPSHRPRNRHHSSRNSVIVRWKRSSGA